MNVVVIGIIAFVYVFAQEDFDLEVIGIGVVGIVNFSLIYMAFNHATSFSKQS